MRRKSKSEYRVEIDKADLALQNFLRARFPLAQCESCGRKVFCYHHFIEKSRCAYLRFPRKGYRIGGVDPQFAFFLNLVPICRKCHSLHHIFGDAGVHGRIVVGRGTDWLKELLRVKDSKEAKAFTLNVKLARDMQKKYKQ